MHAEALDEQDDGAVAPAPPHEVHLPAEPERAHLGAGARARPPASGGEREREM